MNYTQDMRNYFNTHQTLDYQFRVKALKDLKASIHKYEKDIFKALKSDLNRSDYETFMTELGLVYAEITHTLKHLRLWMRPKRKLTGISGFPGSSYQLTAPYGLALIISPWNYPIYLTFMPLIGAIAAGNCVIIKPSELATHTSDIIETIILNTFDPNYIKVVQGDKDITSKLLAERFDYIFFTGSTKVGKIVMEAASKHLTPVTLELGGKNPCLLTEAINIQEAAKKIAFGKVLNSGQICISPDYVLLHSSQLIDFTTYFNKYVFDFLGNPLFHKDYPKIINIDHYNRLKSLLKANTIHSGGNYNDETLSIEPTLILNPKLDSALMQEEIFGPILPLLTYDTIDEALSIIESKEKPLAFYLFTKDKNIEKTLLNTLSFGGASINDVIMHINAKGLAFGGVGESGMGSYHGIHSFNTFSHTKNIYKKHRGFTNPMRFRPYNTKKLNILRQIFK